MEILDLVFLPAVREKLCFFAHVLSITVALGGGLPLPGQTNTPPVVHDAFVQDGDTILRHAHLGDLVQVIVCKNDYDTWRKANSTSQFKLYLDGLAITSPEELQAGTVSKKSGRETGASR